jgi:hypothetical protein
MTTGIASPACPSAPGTVNRQDRQEYPARPRPETWRETQQARPALVERLSNPPFRSDSADVRGCLRRGLTALLDWLEQQPGQTWQERWLASSAEAKGRTWTHLVRREVPSLASRPAGNVHTDLLTAMRMMLTGQVLRPGYVWLLRYRPGVLLQEARDRLDPAGFARLRAHLEATGRPNPQDHKEALNRIAWILLHKGGLICDITIGDCIEISDALQEHQCQGANNRPLFYALLAETGVLPAGAPPILRATRMGGQRTPAELVGKYGLHSQAMRRLIAADLLPERAGQPVKAWVHVTLADLRSLDDGSMLEGEWITAVRAKWAAARAAASIGGSDGAAWLEGDAARGITCDAIVTPIVTGDVDTTVLDDLVKLCVQLDRIEHAADRSEPGPSPTRAGPADPPTSPAREALEKAIIGKTIILLLHSCSEL